ncbi:MAG: hypothetical protein ACI9U2_004829, partial [Bradymonadia bacterium]
MRVAVPVALLLIVVGAVWWALQTAERETSVPEAAIASTLPPQTAGVIANDLTPRAPPSARPTSTLSNAVATALSDIVRERVRRDKVRKSAEGVLAKVAVQAPPAKAVMSQKAVRFAIDQSRFGIEDCYAQALAKSPKLAGRLTMKFSVHVKDGLGTLRDAEVVEDGLGNPFLGMCALGAVAKVEFDAEEDGVVIVSYPFNLSP